MATLGLPCRGRFRGASSLMNDILCFIADNQKRILDIAGALLGLIYILLEYRASIWLWLVSIIMPLVDMLLYYEAGLYADFAMAIYYALAAVYGFAMWKYGWMLRREKAAKQPHELPVTHFPLRRVGWTVAAFALLWAVIWYILEEYTNSTVAVRDAFTTALSMIALWALAQKYVEQWLLWLVVDAVSCWLYIDKGIPFKALLYGLYCFIAVAGFYKWKDMARKTRQSVAATA